MKIFACKVFFLVATAGVISTVLSTTGISTKVVREAVVPETSPGLLALQHGRYSLAQGIDCGQNPLARPQISVLLTKDKIWIEESYGDQWRSPEQLLPARQWKLRSTNGEYDWSAAEDALRDTRYRLHWDISETQLERALIAHQTNRIFSESFRPEQITKIEIAADDDVDYATILTAMDVAVEMEFTEIRYVGPAHLSAHFRE